MYKIFKFKKGQHDVSMLWGIVGIFIAIGVFIPLIVDEFDSDFSEIDTDALTDTIETEPSFSNIGAISVLWSIAKMFFWYGDVFPFWLDALIFEPMRIMLYVLIYRQVRSGGG